MSRSTPRLGLFTLTCTWAGQVHTHFTHISCSRESPSPVTHPTHLRQAMCGRYTLSNLYTIFTWMDILIWPGHPHLPWTSFMWQTPPHMICTTSHTIHTVLSVLPDPHTCFGQVYVAGMPSQVTCIPSPEMFSPRQVSPLDPENSERRPAQPACTFTCLPVQTHKSSDTHLLTSSHDPDTPIYLTCTPSPEP